MWIALTVAGFFIVRFLWRAYVHPAHVLGRQAAHMNWIAAGAVRDEHGYRNVRVSRQGYEAVISYKHGNVKLVRPSRLEPFKDFIELERWLAQPESQVFTYLKDVETYITRMGWYEKLLLLEGTDPDYCRAVLKMYHAGFQSRQPAKVVGALAMESANRYTVNRDLSIYFLEALEENFLTKSDNVVSSNA